jgi:hypothetical protein
MVFSGPSALFLAHRVWWAANRIDRDVLERTLHSKRSGCCPKKNPFGNAVRPFFLNRWKWRLFLPQGEDRIGAPCAPGSSNQAVLLTIADSYELLETFGSAAKTRTEIR